MRILFTFLFFYGIRQSWIQTDLWVMNINDRNLTACCFRNLPYRSWRCRNTIIFMLTTFIKGDVKLNSVEQLFLLLTWDYRNRARTGLQYLNHVNMLRTRGPTNV